MERRIAIYLNVQLNNGMVDTQNAQSTPKSSDSKKILLWVIAIIAGLAVAVFGIWVWVGFSTFQKEAVKAHRVAITNDLNKLAAEIYKYRVNKKII